MSTKKNILIPLAPTNLVQKASQSVFCFHVSYCRRVMCIRRPSRLWSTPSPVRLLTTLRCGQPLHPPTVTSVRGCCGVSPVRACAAQSAGSNATKSARTSSMPTAYRVSEHDMPMTSIPTLSKNCYSRVFLHFFFLRNTETDGKRSITDKCYCIIKWNSLQGSSMPMQVMQHLFTRGRSSAYVCICIFIEIWFPDERNCNTTIYYVI